MKVTKNSHFCAQLWNTEKEQNMVGNYNICEAR